jgi:hypothetical protein
MLGLPHNVAWEPFTQAAGLVAIAFLLFIAAVSAHTDTQTTALPVSPYFQL